MLTSTIRQWCCSIKRRKQLPRTASCRCSEVCLVANTDLPQVKEFHVLSYQSEITFRRGRWNVTTLNGLYVKSTFISFSSNCHLLHLYVSHKKNKYLTHREIKIFLYISKPAANVLRWTLIRQKYLNYSLPFWGRFLCITHAYFTLTFHFYHFLCLI